MEKCKREGTDGMLPVQAWADVYFWENTNVRGHLQPLCGAKVSEINFNLHKLATLPFAGQDCVYYCRAQMADI